MNRRQALRALLALPLAATFDVEKWLWLPGQMVTVPHPKQTAFIAQDLDALKWFHAGRRGGKTLCVIRSVS